MNRREAGGASQNRSCTPDDTITASIPKSVKKTIVGAMMCEICGWVVTDTGDGHSIDCPARSPMPALAVRSPMPPNLSRDFQFPTFPSEGEDSRPCGRSSPFSFPIRRYDYRKISGSGIFSSSQRKQPFPQDLKVAQSVLFATQGRVTIVSADAVGKKGILGLYTDGANPCCIVVLHVPGQCYVMCHFDAVTNMIPGLEHMATQFGVATESAIIFFPLSHNDGPLVVKQLACEQLLCAQTAGFITGETFECPAGNQKLVDPHKDKSASGHRMISNLGNASALFWFGSDKIFLDPGARLVGSNILMSRSEQPVHLGGPIFVVE